MILRLAVGPFTASTRLVISLIIRCAPNTLCLVQIPCNTFNSLPHTTTMEVGQFSNCPSHSIVFISYESHKLAKIEEIDMNQHNHTLVQV